MIAAQRLTFVVLYLARSWAVEHVKEANADDVNSLVQLSTSHVVHERALAPVSPERPRYSAAPSCGEVAFLAIQALNQTALVDFGMLGEVQQAGADNGEAEVQSGDSMKTLDRIAYSWTDDAFPDEAHTHKDNGDEGWAFFKEEPPREWIILAVFCVVFFIADYLVLQRIPNSFRCHLSVVCFWVVVAFIYGWGFWQRQGKKRAFEWFSGYILEWMLSMDNLFVFHLIFSTYKTPKNQIHKAVFLGIFGAVIMRLIFFMVVSTLLRLATWVRWPFGLLLVWSGIEAARGGDDDTDVQDTFLIRMLKRCFGGRLRDEYDEEGCACIVYDKEGRFQFTILVVVVFCLEFTDVVFALDSVTAKVAQIPDTFIAFSSSVLAMYGLRAMFFIVEDMVDMFDLLQYGLCLILIFIGCELVFYRWIHISSGTVCLMIIAVFVFCILGSHVKQRLLPNKEDKEDEDVKVAEDDATKDPEINLSSIQKAYKLDDATAVPVKEEGELLNSCADEDPEIKQSSDQKNEKLDDATAVPVKEEGELLSSCADGDSEVKQPNDQKADTLDDSTAKDRGK